MTLKGLLSERQRLIDEHNRTGDETFRILIAENREQIHTHSEYPKYQQRVKATRKQRLEQSLSAIGR